MGVLEMERVTLKQETVVAFVRNCSLYNQVCLSQHLQIAPHLVPYLFADSRRNQTARKKITTTQKNLQNQLQENDGAEREERKQNLLFCKRCNQRKVSWKRSPSALMTRKFIFMHTYKYYLCNIISAV